MAVGKVSFLSYHKTNKLMIDFRKIQSFQIQTSMGKIS